MPTYIFYILCSYSYLYFPDIPVEKQTIPSQVFGSLKTTDGEDD